MDWTHSTAARGINVAKWKILFFWLNRKTNIILQFISTIEKRWKGVRWRKQE
jgi:hypothetical protein